MILGYYQDQGHDHNFRAMATFRIGSICTIIASALSGSFESSFVDLRHLEVTVTFLDSRSGLVNNVETTCPLGYLHCHCISDLTRTVFRHEINSATSSVRPVIDTSSCAYLTYCSVVSLTNQWHASIHSHLGMKIHSSNGSSDPVTVIIKLAANELDTNERSSSKNKYP